MAYTRTGTRDVLDHLLGRPELFLSWSLRDMHLLRRVFQQSFDLLSMDTESVHQYGSGAHTRLEEFTWSRWRSSGVSRCLLTGLYEPSSASLETGVPDVERYEGPGEDIFLVVEMTRTRRIGDKVWSRLGNVTCMLVISSILLLY